MGYGNVVAAGSILRRDYPEENKLILGKAPMGGIRAFMPGTYAGFFAHHVEKNILYLASPHGPRRVSTGGCGKDFPRREPQIGALVYEGLMDHLVVGEEGAAQKAEDNGRKGPGLRLFRGAGGEHAGVKELHENIRGPSRTSSWGKAAEERTKVCREQFLAAFQTG